jgi:valyl-tRNA synthetase
LYSNKHVLDSLGRVEATGSAAKPEGLRLTSVSDAWLELSAKEITSFLSALKVSLDKQRNTVKQLESRLANKSYVENAPKAIVDQTNTQLKEARDMLDKLAQQYEGFSK